RRVYTITSIIYSSRAKKRSNFFTLLVDIYLIGSRVKRKVFKTLSGFRLYYSYYSANYIINSIAKEAERYLKTLAHNLQIVVIYNNVNFKDTKRNKLLGYTSIIRLLITATTILYPELPLFRLR
ncbi:hypothetical protein V2W45_1251009, partial [Cenococcum geophilum]